MNTRYLAALLSFTLCSVSSVRAETLEWIQQLGTHQSEKSYSVSADGLGNVYISGRTSGNLGGTHAGGFDAYVSKYDASGTLDWTQQLGSSEYDNGWAVSADGVGGVYISGVTEGNLEGTNAGGYDAFLAKYDASGMLQWTQQLGTSETDRALGVSADGLGNVYISGDTAGSLEGTNAGGVDAFLAKYDASGTLEWTQQFGTGSDQEGRGVSADGMGNVYISGATSGIAFLAKYDDSGTFEWIRSLGNCQDEFGHEKVRVSADGLGNAYISGATTGNLEGSNAGGSDAFVSKYDAAGTLQWIRQFGTSRHEASHGVSADGLGNVYITGYNDHKSSGTSPGDGYDAFISKYDASGTLEWTREFGTNSSDSGRGVSADGLGNVYISGSTRGSLGGPFQGGVYDAFVAKITDPLPGDVNLDGLVNGLDVDPFVEVLLSGPYQPEADMNEDQVVNGLDVDPFVAAVVGGAHQIPEPSTLLLTLIALGVVGGWRKWKRTA